MKHGITKTMVLITIIIMDMLVGMEFDLFVPSFPQMQQQFNLTPFWVEALLSINFAGFCLSLFFVGSAADHYGRKPVILIGLVTFIFGSILCIWAPIYNVLFAGRFLQGLGIAAPTILSFLIIADSYPMKQQQFILAMFNAIMNVSVAAAPVLGSYITLYFHWEGNFVVLLVLGGLALAMTIFFIPDFKLPKVKETLSLQGYMQIFKSRPLMLLIINIVFIFAPYWIFVGMSPILYMKDLGVSLTHFGYYQGVLALIFAIGSLICGFIISKHDQKKMLYISNAITIFGLLCIALVTYSNSTSPMLITLALLPFIIGQVIPTIILYPLCLNFIPQAKAKASAVIQGGRLILSAMALQVAGYFYQGSFQNIGIIIIGFIVVAIITLFLVIRNRELMS